WDGGAFVTNFSHSYRAPARRAYNNGPHDGTLAFEVGNSALKAEQSNAIDAAIRHQKGRVKAEANVFYYDIKDFVFLAPTGVNDPESGLEIANYVQGNSRFVGTGAESRLHSSQVRECARRGLIMSMPG
ncbi:MAG: TonB-dependent receptor, partial [Chloracidobacterium sp.]|nr:TonB-dependent receptor [Chloracidobacterium sp.]